MSDDVRFVFGAMSPYSWFAAERIGALVPHATWVPVFAGGLFASRGWPSWGTTGERAEKMADCDVRAREHGLGPISWPEPWPTNDVKIARALVVAEQDGKLQELALTAMRMAFTEGADLGAQDVVDDAASRVGIADVAKRSVGADVKQRLRELTDGAFAQGVEGVPTVIVKSKLYWGDDRVDEAAEAASIS